MAEETDETLFWFEVLVESEFVRPRMVESLMSECEELLKFFPPYSALQNQIVKSLDR